MRALLPGRGLFTAACLAFVWSVMAAPLAAQILYGSIVGVVKDTQGAVMPGADGHDRQSRHQPDARDDRGRARELLPRQRPCRVPTTSRCRCRDFATTSDPGVPVTHRPDLARGGDPRNRRAHRNDHRRLVHQPAADRFGRRAHRAQVRRDRGAAAEPVPQLSGADESGARHHADGVRQRRNRYAGAVAGHQRQRPAEHQQLDAHRRRHEHEHLAAESQHVHLAGRDRRCRQHFDEQLRRRTRAWPAARRSR